MLEFNTLDQFGINIQFSPHDRNLLAFVSGSHYGIQGQGQVSVINFDLTENRIREVKKWICTDVQTDLDWNPKSENIFITSSGDGSIRYKKNMCFGKYSMIFNSNDVARYVLKTLWHFKFNDPDEFLYQE